MSFLTTGFLLVSTSVNVVVVTTSVFVLSTLESLLMSAFVSSLGCSILSASNRDFLASRSFFSIAIVSSSAACSLSTPSAIFVYTLVNCLYIASYWSRCSLAVGVTGLSAFITSLVSVPALLSVVSACARPPAKRVRKAIPIKHFLTNSFITYMMTFILA